MSRQQSQASLADQLKELILIANREGLYDASDYIKNRLEEQSSVRRNPEGR